MTTSARERSLYEFRTHVRTLRREFFVTSDVGVDNKWPDGMVAQEIVIGKHFLPARCTETHVNLGFWSAPSAPIAPNRVGPAQQISPILVTIND